MELNYLYACRKCSEEDPHGLKVYRSRSVCAKHGIEMESFIHNGGMLPYGFTSDFIARTADELMDLIKKYAEAVSLGKDAWHADEFLEAIIRLNLSNCFTQEEK